MKILATLSIFLVVGCASSTGEYQATREAQQVFGLTTNMTCSKRHPGQPEFCECFVGILKEVTPQKIVQSSISNLSEYQSEMTSIMIENRDKLSECDQYKKP